MRFPQRPSGGPEVGALIRRMRTSDSGFSGAFAALTRVNADQDEKVDSVVRAILRDVQSRGDPAVLEYTNRFDRLDANRVAELEIPRTDWLRALENLQVEQRSALEEAASRIMSFHERQKAASWRFADDDGSVLGQQVTPLDRAGIYVPGGKAAYPSSVLMNALPAKVAGVAEIFMVVPTPDGYRNPLVLAAAALAGVDRVFAIGGAQAIGALAFGTQTIPHVDKIVGPGNAFVAAAKRQVFGHVGIDMIAGPSEILVICDGKTDPDWIAMDLFSQAEHDELAQSILMSPDADFLNRVEESISRLIGSLPRRNAVQASLSGRGALIQVENLQEACTLANMVAPEHLELSVEEPEILLESIRHAGAIFLGRYSSESLGDYCAGPNHVLPTSGTARFSSPLGVYDFQKRSSILAVSRSGAQRLGRITGTLARGEGLLAHALSAEYRLDKH